jgi:cytochrome P450
VPTIVDGHEVTTLLNELTTMVGRTDPYPRYARLREISPVVRAEDGALVVTCYANCATVTRDPRFVHMPPDALAFLGFPDWAGRPALRQLFTSLLALNPPDHTRPFRCR